MALLRDTGGGVLWDMIVCDEGERDGRPGREWTNQDSGGLSKVVEDRGQTLHMVRLYGDLQGIPLSGVNLRGLTVSMIGA